MPAKTDQQQVNQYDKIIRENLENTLPVFIKDVLKLNIVTSEEVPDDLQHTKERKPDALKKVTDSNGDSYILHLEFQVANERQMVFRMAEYSIMLMRRYGVPVRQFVIFLKANKPTMPLAIDTPRHKYNYELIRISEVSYKLFLRSKNPEVKMLAILGSFGSDEPEEALQRIINEIGNTTKSELTKSRYQNQIRIFVQLRPEHDHLIKTIMQSVSTFFKKERDFLYKEGEQKGFEKAQAKAELEKKEIARQTASALKKEKVAIETITKVTGLSKEEIEAL